MSKPGSPQFTYHVFDVIYLNDFNEHYGMRNNKLYELNDYNLLFDEHIKVVLPTLIHNYDRLVAYEHECLGNNYEGIILRSLDGPYKFGRSTVKEGYLLKIKRFDDSEAVIIDFEELLHNKNEQFADNLGLSERSTCKENMLHGNTLGSIVVTDLASNVTFSIGSGLTFELRNKIWSNKSHYLGKIVKYKHQKSGSKDLPRFPVFLGFRDPIDM